MQSPWHDLLANFAIIAILFSVWTLSEQWTYSWSRRRRSVAFGLLCGFGAIALMLLPFHFSKGVVIDLRSTLIAISGLFGGPLSVALTAVMALLFRASLGGTGMWIGFFGIGVATAIGTGAHVLLLKRRIPGGLNILAFAGAVAVGGSLNFFLVRIALWSTILPNVALPVAALLFVSTLLTGLALAQGRRREEAITQNRLYRAIIDALPDCLHAKDAGGRYVAANPATARLLGAARVDDLVGKSDRDFFPAEIAQGFADEDRRILQTRQPSTFEQNFTRSDGETTWLSTLKAPFYDGAGRLVGIISHNREITQQKQIELALEESQQRLSDALTHMADALVMFDRHGTLVFSNSQYQALFPLTADIRVPGAKIRDIVRIGIERGEEAESGNDDIHARIERICASYGNPGDRHIRLADGRWLEARTRPTRDGACLIAFSDVTRTKEAERRLEAIADTDALTGLSNRRVFDRELEKEVSRSKRNGTPLSLLLLDLDQFKAFNDTYGHPEGDACLRAVSQCLRDSLRRPSDIGARYGGEEFAVILPGTSEEGALTVAEAFRNAVSALRIPHAGSTSAVMTVSIGVSHMADGLPADSLTLLRRADEALYRAKAQGRNRVRIWHPQTGPQQAVA